MIRLAMIGCPEVASYARVAPRLRGGKFTAVADDDARAAASATEALGAAVACGGFDALLTNHGEAFDAIVLGRCGAAVSAAPEQAGRLHHKEICKRATAAGKDILIDGPLVDSVAEAQSLITACPANVRLMIGNTLRFLPSVRTVKEARDSGRLGEPGLVRIHCWEPQEAGRLAAGQITREIDLACWLFGQRPDTVYAVDGSRTECHSVLLGELNYMQLHLGFANGGMALIDRACTLPRGGAYFSLSLIGSTGAAYADDHHNRQLLFAGGQPAAIPTGEGDIALLAELQEFVTAIGAGRNPLVTGADALTALQVAEAAVTSLATHEAVHLVWLGQCEALAQL